jgi:hypothetical protein
MANQLTEFPSKPRRRYPWDEWLNGEVWQVQQGEDFDCTMASFYTLLWVTAKTRGGKARTTRDGNTLTFQFVKEEA